MSFKFVLFFQLCVFFSIKFAYFTRSFEPKLKQSLKIQCAETN